MTTLKTQRYGDLQTVATVDCEALSGKEMQMLLEQSLTKQFAKHREPLAFRVGTLLAMAACVAIQVYLLMVSEVSR